MRVAVASGKGGTGKTSVAAALAAVRPDALVLVDLDVEAPNLHLFVHPTEDESLPVLLETPVVRPERCQGCGTCADLCQFGALAVLGGRAQVFPEQCHGCGGCLRVCPHQALAPGQRPVGEVRVGRSGRHTVVTGVLRLGEALAPPVIRQARAQAEALAQGRDMVLDAPPGVSCPAMAAVEGADAVLLVTEPTPFGFHDFRLAHAAVADLGVPVAVVLNRVGLGEAPVEAYCQEHGLPVLAHIPYDPVLARLYARGSTLAEEPRVRAAMEAVWRGLRRAGGDHA